MDCRRSGRSLLGAVLATCTLVALAAVLISFTVSISWGLGFVGLAFVSLAYLVIPMLLLPRESVVRIDETGIEDRRQRTGVLGWEDICTLSTRTYYSTKFLCIELVDATKYRSRLTPWQRFMARANPMLEMGDIAINFSGLEPGIYAVWEHITASHYLCEQTVTLEDE